MANGKGKTTATARGLQGVQGEVDSVLCGEPRAVVGDGSKVEEET